MREGVGLPSESTTNKGANHVDLVHGHLEHRGQGSVCVVGDLLRGVELQAAVGVPVRHHRVRLGEAMVHALKAPCSARGRGRIVHRGAVTKGLVHALLHVGRPDVVLATPMDRLVHVLKPLPRIEFGRQFLVINHDGVQGLHRRGFVNRRDARHQVTHVAHLLDRHRVFVLGHGKHAKGVRRVFTCRNGEHAGHGLGRARVDGTDARVMVRGPEDTSNRLVRQPDIVSVPRLSRHLGVGINQGGRPTNRRSGSKPVMHMVSGRLPFSTSDRFWNRIQVPWRGHRLGASSTRRLKTEFSCHPRPVFPGGVATGPWLLAVPCGHWLTSRAPAEGWVRLAQQGGGLHGEAFGVQRGLLRLGAPLLQP